ncbi:MAG TPA: sigma-70 family RNA polymerase sigma factor [Kofleriaceae bacterium]|nr:sigma-70 family RNA polymerase sigma factor [Kofleriaceae bacterium]
MKHEAKPSWQALIDLMAPFHDDARLFARRIARSNADGDDLFQDAVLRAAIKLPGLRDTGRFRAWFYQVLVSVHRSRCRRSFWRRAVPEDAPEAAGAGEDGAAWAERRAGAERAVLALARLPAPQREAIVLFELHGYSVEEIAEVQRTSISSVKSRLSRGRVRLRRFYDDLADPLSPEGGAKSLPVQEECHG